MKKRRLALVLAGLAAVALLPAAPALAAAKPTAAVSAITPPPGIKFDPGKAKCTAVSGAPSTTKRCRQAERLPLKDLTAAQRAQRQQLMTQAAAKGKQLAPGAASASAAPAATTGPPAACGFGSTAFPPVYVASPSRLLSCVDGLWTVFDYEVIDGAFSLVGNFSFEDLAWFTYSATSTSWVHDMQTLVYPGDGTLADGTTGILASNCYLVPTACTATNGAGPDPQSVVLAAGSTYAYQWTEHDAGPVATTAGAVDNLDANLGVAWDLSDGTQTWDTQETGVVSGRCDSVAVSNSKGCVDEAFIPTMYPSYAVDGAAADMIDYAQNNLDGRWGQKGVGQPLHRLVNSIVQDNNREVICDKSFTPNSSITAALAPFNDTDSCDEFPFASTYESGAMVDGFDGNQKPYVTTGANCAQATAVHTSTANKFEPTDWSTITLTGNTSESAPCIRAHIPNLLNGHVGSEYSALIRTARLIDKDPFWIEVTG